jgi:hypothetical protein
MLFGFCVAGQDAPGLPSYRAVLRGHAIFVHLHKNEPAGLHKQNVVCYSFKVTVYIPALCLSSKKLATVCRGDKTIGESPI